MTQFRGCIAFEADFQRPEDRDRASSGFSDPGLARTRGWSDPTAAFGLAQRAITHEDTKERQPVADAHGRVILFSGYLFDPAGIRADLGISPEATDSEITSCWVARHGVDTLHRLKGDYSFALWTPHQRQLHLAVSAMAMRLIYWHARPGGVWFATTLSALHQFPGVPREIDPLELALSFAAFVTDPARTQFKDIFLVPPGTHLCFSPDGMREQAFWRPDTSRRIQLRHPQDYAEAALDLLDRSVKARLRGMRLPGATVSGGLDSSAVVASAALQCAPDELQTYTAVPDPSHALTGADGWYDDEQSRVEALAARYPNIRPSFCHAPGPTAFEENPARLFLAGGRNFMNAGHVGWFDALYRAARADGHQTLLIGNQGNFTLSFDGLRGMSDFARAGRIDKLLRFVVPAVRYRGKSLWRQMKANILLPALPPRLRDNLWRRMHGGAFPWSRTTALRPEFARQIGLDEAVWAAGSDGMFLHQADSRQFQANFLHAHRTRTLENRVTLGAYYGLEARDPFADSDLVDFCLAIPREQFLWDGRTRSLARRALAERLPPVILDEPRHGQQNPDWFARLSAQRASFAEEVERLAHVPLAADMLDLPRLKNLLDNWPKDAEAAKARRFEFEHLLPRAIQTGRFIRWCGGGNQ